MTDQQPPSSHNLMLDMIALTVEKLVTSGIHQTAASQKDPIRSALLHGLAAALSSPAYPDSEQSQKSFADERFARMTVNAFIQNLDPTEIGKSLGGEAMGTILSLFATPERVEALKQTIAGKLHATMDGHKQDGRIDWPAVFAELAGVNINLVADATPENPNLAEQLAAQASKMPGSRSTKPLTEVFGLALGGMLQQNTAENSPIRADATTDHLHFAIDARQLVTSALASTYLTQSEGITATSTPAAGSVDFAQAPTIRFERHYKNPEEFKAAAANLGELATTIRKQSVKAGMLVGSGDIGAQLPRTGEAILTIGHDIARLVSGLETLLNDLVTHIPAVGSELALFSHQEVTDLLMAGNVIQHHLEDNTHVITVDVEALSQQVQSAIASKLEAVLAPGQIEGATPISVISSSANGRNLVDVTIPHPSLFKLMGAGFAEAQSIIHATPEEQITRLSGYMNATGQNLIHHSERLEQTTEATPPGLLSMGRMFKSMASDVQLRLKSLKEAGLLLDPADGLSGNLVRFLAGKQQQQPADKTAQPSVEQVVQMHKLLGAFGTIFTMTKSFDADPSIVEAAANNTETLTPSILNKAADEALEQSKTAHPTASHY